VKGMSNKQIIKNMIAEIIFWHDTDVKEN